MKRGCVNDAELHESDGVVFVCFPRTSGVGTRLAIDALLVHGHAADSAARSVGAISLGSTQSLVLAERPSAVTSANHVASTILPLESGRCIYVSVKRVARGGLVVVNAPGLVQPRGPASSHTWSTPWPVSRVLTHARTSFTWDAAERSWRKG